MLELGRREKQILSGLGVQVLVVAILVFAYSQAARQLKMQREMFLKLHEQLQSAKLQVARESGRLDLEKLRAEVVKLEDQLLSSGALQLLAQRLEDLAQDRFGFLDLELKEGAVEKRLEIPVKGGLGLTIELKSLQIKGTATSRNVAALLAAIHHPGFKLLCPLEEIELKTAKEKEPLPVAVELKWLVATVPSRPPEWGAKVESWAPPEKPSLRWGAREELFVSPLLHRQAVRIPSEVLKRFRLTGILWDAKAPSCVINGSHFKLGDWVEGVQVVLITQESVILQGPQGELFLSLS